MYIDIFARLVKSTGSQTIIKYPVLSNRTRRCCLQSCNSVRIETLSQPGLSNMAAIPSHPGNFCWTLSFHDMLPTSRSAWTTRVGELRLACVRHRLAGSPHRGGGRMQHAVCAGQHYQVDRQLHRTVWEERHDPGQEVWSFWSSRWIWIVFLQSSVAMKDACCFPFPDLLHLSFNRVD